MDERLETEESKDTEGLFLQLKNWFSLDYDLQSEWRKDAKEDFAFVAGDQWTEEDKAKMRAMLRPIITMNRIDPIIDSVSGSEVANRQEVRYIPREQGDVKVNEILTSAAEWFRQQCDAEDEESDAFRDTLICGMGWTETRLDYETDPDGTPVIERIDPLQMVWGSSARKRNLADMSRVFHIMRDIPIEDARALIKNESDFEDADFNATWVDGEEADQEAQRNDHKSYNKGEEQNEASKHSKVTMVRAQWWERETVHRVVDPANPQNLLTLDEDDFTELSAKVKIATGAEPKSVKATRKVYKQAYLGAKVLDSGDAPCKDHFSFDCITGKRDRNKNQWYGLVRGMKDAQRWANKWLSQSLHILNSSAKGGVMAERSAFENDADAEASWARNDIITWAKTGALSGPNSKIQPKPQSAIPAGFYQLMEFAISSIRDVSGVNIEILGMQSDSSQAASLDRQRKQSSMTILQPLFDSLRRYRKMQGRKLLYLIQNYLSDGRLVRVVGNDQARYLPLIKQPGVAQYDVIVDDAPSSPNQKEATWAMLQQILPAVGKMLPPATWIALLEFSPLPTSAQDKIKQSIQEAQQNQGPDPEVAKMQAKMDLDRQKAMQDVELSQQKMAHESQLSQQKAAAEFELKQSSAAVDAMIAQQKLEQEFVLARQRADMEFELETYKAGLAAKVELAKPQPQEKAS